MYFRLMAAILNFPCILRLDIGQVLLGLVTLPNPDNMGRAVGSSFCYIYMPLANVRNFCYMALKPTNQIRFAVIPFCCSLVFIKLFKTNNMLIFNELRVELPSCSMASRTSRFLSKLRRSDNSLLNLIS